ncbi:MAG: dephospho-CoA kinase [Oscillospiraceae bacterium]|jgi:dephospho-CoA kinase|nr:dephospho-CoA kinase [Oscillospiraceae bacterium]
MIIVGLTGGIASGKSTISAALRKLGAPVIDADEISRGLTASGGGALEAIRNRFGPEVFDEAGGLIRARLAARIFSDPVERAALDDIVHPIVIQQSLSRLDELRRGGAAAAVLEAPLLIEAGMDRYVDEVWVTYLPREEQLARLIARDGLTDEQARARVSSQSSFARKARVASVIIPTTGAMERARAKAAAQWSRLLNANAGAPYSPKQKTGGSFAEHSKERPLQEGSLDNNRQRK